MAQRRGIGACSVILLALVFGLVGGGLGAYLYVTRLSPPTSGGTSQVNVGPQPVKIVTQEDATIEAVKRVSPGVVKIVSTRLVEPSNPIERLFGVGPQEQAAMGSGFVFEHEGEKLILTNTHVIGGADTLVVKTIGGEEFEAEKLGADPARDIAVIKPISPPADLAALPLGDSTSVQVGQKVLAAGNPFDFENTVTEGIVSAMGWREIAGSERYVIQTDAAINTGNSGGPLLDLGGNVIGINFAIFSPTRTSLGIGFAIPINQAKEMMYFLVNRGPWLGLHRLHPNSRGVARYLGLRTDKGVVVLGLAQDGPAARAGLQPGDVILKVAGEAVTDADQLQEKIRRYRIAEEIPLTVQRGDEQREIRVKAGTIPDGYY
jgi:S1-C subfamily serine protease